MPQATLNTIKDVHGKDIVEARLDTGQILTFPGGTDTGIIQNSISKVLKGEIAQPKVPGKPGLLQDIVTAVGGPIGGPGVGFATPTAAEIGETGPEALKAAGRIATGGFDFLEEKGAQTFGAIGGAAAGTAIAGPVGTIPGAFIGGAGGEGIKQTAQAISRDPGAPKTSGEAAKKLFLAGGEEALFEAVGGVAAKGVGKVIAPFAKKIKPEAAQVIEAFKSKRTAPILLPAEASESKILEALQGISSLGIIGDDAMKLFKTDRDKFLQNYADDLIQQFGKNLSAEEIGQAFTTAISRKKDFHRGVSEILYNKVSEKIAPKTTTRQISKEVPAPTALLPEERGFPKTRTVTKPITKTTPEVKISTKSLKDLARKELKSLKEVDALLSPASGKSVLEDTLDLPNEISYEAARELRSDLLSRAREFSVVNKNAKVVRRSNQLAALMDEATESGLVNSGNKEALKAWRTANKFFIEGKEGFNNKLVRTFIKKADDAGVGAEMIAPAVFKPGRVTTLRNVKRALGEEDFKKMKGWFVEDLFNRSLQEGNISGQKLLNVLDGQRTSFGISYLKEVFAGPELKGLFDYANALKLTQVAKKPEFGKAFFKDLPFGGAIKTTGEAGIEIAAPFGKAAATLLIGPEIVSKLILNPKTSKILIEGLKLPAGSAQAAGLIARLMPKIMEIEALEQAKQQFLVPETEPKQPQKTQGKPRLTPSTFESNKPNLVPALGVK